jgi:hypothetical protein
MDKTEWMITENYWDYKVEKMLFTYNENEIQENRFNKFIVEQERKWWSYFVIEQQQLALWFSEAEAIMFNFIDWYTKSWKYFWYSTQDICEKTYWWKDKVIGTIKSLVKKWYVIREKWKDRFWNERRFLSTTTKYSLELLKLRGVSENQIGGIWKSDRGVSEKPTHSIIYSNINSNNIIENQNQEQSQDTNVSFPKQDSITPNLTNGDLTFEKIYKLFYHKSWHKPSIDKCRKVFESLNLDTEWYNMLVKDLNLFRIEYKYWIKDQMYRPWFEKYVWWFNAEWVNEEYRLRTIIKFHMEHRDDIDKMKKRYKDLCDTFWKDTVDKLVKEYGRAKNKITLNIN